MSSTQCFEAASIKMASSALSAAAHTLRGLNAKWPLAQGENGPSRCGMVGSIQLLLSGNAVSPPSGTSAQFRDRGLWLSAFKHTQGNQSWAVQYGRGASCPECTCMPAMRHHARVVLGRFHSVCRRVLLACMHTCIHTHGDQVDPPPSSPLRYKSTVHTRGPAAPSARLSICGLQRGEGSTYSADRGRGRWMSPPAYACM